MTKLTTKIKTLVWIHQWVINVLYFLSDVIRLHNKCNVKMDIIRFYFTIIYLYEIFEDWRKISAEKKSKMIKFSKELFNAIKSKG